MKEKMPDQADLDAPLIKNKVIIPLQEIYDKSELVYIPAYSDDDEDITLPSFFLNNVRFSPEQSCSIIADSNDMSPIISKGAHLIVDRSQKELINNHIMMIKTGDNLLMRRINSPISGAVIFKPDNPNCKSRTFTAEETKNLNILGRIVYIIQRP